MKRDIREGIGNVVAFPPEITDNPSIFDVKTENFEVIRIGITGQIPCVLLRRLEREKPRAPRRDSATGESHNQLL